MPRSRAPPIKLRVNALCGNLCRAVCKRRVPKPASPTYDPGLGSWPGILAWDPGLGSWPGILAWDPVTVACDTLRTWSPCFARAAVTMFLLLAWLEDL